MITISNGSLESIKRVEKITNKKNKKINFIKGDIREEVLLAKSLVGCSAVIHFAGLKAVGESNLKPIEYYENNVSGTVSLLKAMMKNNIKKFIFSSSSTVSGVPEKLPIDESHKLNTTNPYERTKLVIEGILYDLYQSDNSWPCKSLREVKYFILYPYVLEVLNAFLNIANKNIPYKIQERRLGDVESCFADIKFAKRMLFREGNEKFI